MIRSREDVKELFRSADMNISDDDAAVIFRSYSEKMNSDDLQEEVLDLVSGGGLLMGSALVKGAAICGVAGLVFAGAALSVYVICKKIDKQKNG